MCQFHRTLYGIVCRANAFMRASKALHFYAIGCPLSCRYSSMPVVAQLSSCSASLGCHRSICMSQAMPSHGLMVRVPAAASGAYSPRAVPLY
jgi:hypothetical protein